VTWLHVVSVTLVWSGVLMVAVSCLVALRVRDFFDRLHLLAALSMVAVPLIVVGLAVDSGGWRAAAKLVLIALVSIAAGVPITVATARVADGRGQGFP